jgi:hypothetical protein
MIFCIIKGRGIRLKRTVNAYLNDCEGLNLAPSCAIRKLLNNVGHESIHLKEPIKFPLSIKYAVHSIMIVLVRKEQTRIIQQTPLKNKPDQQI